MKKKIVTSNIEHRPLTFTSVLIHPHGEAVHLIEDIQTGLMNLTTINDEDEFIFKQSDPDRVEAIAELFLEAVKIVKAK